MLGVGQGSTTSAAQFNQQLAALGYTEPSCVHYQAVSDRITTLLAAAESMTNLVELRPDLRRPIEIPFPFLSGLRLYVHYTETERTFVCMRYSPDGTSAHCLTCRSTRRCHHFQAIQTDCERSRYQEAAAQSLSRHEDVMQKSFNPDGSLMVMSKSQVRFGQYAATAKQAMRDRTAWIQRHTGSPTMRSSACIVCVSVFHSTALVSFKMLSANVVESEGANGPWDGSFLTEEAVLVMRPSTVVCPDCVGSSMAVQTSRGHLFLEKGVLPITVEVMKCQACQQEYRYPANQLIRMIPASTRLMTESTMCTCMGVCSYDGALDGIFNWNNNIFIDHLVFWYKAELMFGSRNFFPMATFWGQMLKTYVILASCRCCVLTSDGRVSQLIRSLPGLACKVYVCVLGHVNGRVFFLLMWTGCLSEIHTAGTTLIMHFKSVAKLKNRIACLSTGLHILSFAQRGRHLSYFWSYHINKWRRVQIKSALVLHLTEPFKHS
jgi:hypothetical protein